MTGWKEEWKAEASKYEESGCPATPVEAGLCVALSDAHWPALHREPMTCDFVSSSSNRCCCLWCRPLPPFFDQVGGFVQLFAPGANPNTQCALEAAKRNLAAPCMRYLLLDR
jgi:hypothetical protein